MRQVRLQLQLQKRNIPFLETTMQLRSGDKKNYIRDKTATVYRQLNPLL